jgi:cysteinyl-tRNA synthetase
MSSKYLGESFDIHTGGVDNIFPHHEDEIAQSEAASGKPFVRYWMHCAHLVVDGRKMSKSLGNFFTLRQVFERGYSGREVRYVLMSAHYRQALNFTFDALDGARASLARIDGFMARLREAGGGKGQDTLPDWAERARVRFRDAITNDLAISEALAALFDMVHDGHRALDHSPGEANPGAVLSLMEDWERVLGLLHIPKLEADARVQALLASREKARQDKNWAESDRLRRAIEELGWEVRDTPAGAKLKPKAI